VSTGRDWRKDGSETLRTGDVVVLVVEGVGGGEEEVRLADGARCRTPRSRGAKKGKRGGKPDLNVGRQNRGVHGKPTVRDLKGGIVKP